MKFMISSRGSTFKATSLEEIINFICNEMKARHIDRVKNQECTLENGFVFNDLLTDYERIADHCSNVAVDVIDSESDEIHGHEYHRSIEYKTNEQYKADALEFGKKYAL